MRRDARVPELQRVADRPPRRRGAPAATTATTRSRCRRRCAQCAGPYLEQVGFGTERVEAESRALLPERARRARRSRHHPAARRDRRAAARGSPAASIDVLVGTQMIAKGHDFPRGDAGRRGLGRCRARPGRFPRRRADVPAADAGGRPRRPRRDRRRSDRADAASRPLQHPARLPAGLRAFYERGDPLPPRPCAIRRPSR